MAIPVQKQFTVHIASGQQVSNQTVSIPAGKTMTITHVSGKLTVPVQQVATVRVSEKLCMGVGRYSGWRPASAAAGPLHGTRRRAFLGECPG